MNPRPAVRFLRRRGLLIGVAALLGAGLAGGYAATQQPLYQATASTFVSVSDGATLRDLSDQRLARQVVQSYTDVATTPSVLNRVIQALALSETPAHLAGRVDVEAPADQAVLHIHASDPSPIHAADLSNTVARQLSAVVSRLTPQSTSGTATSKVRLIQIQAARPAASPATPIVPSMVTQGLVAGLLVGLVLAVQLDRRRGLRDASLPSRSDERRG